jgi:aspartyl-tRNA(Asn)/glutamyl-tRNA(Gln) amidotransferase subunit C
MRITEKEVAYVAALANLELNEAETRRMAHDLDEILSHMEALNEVDTTGVEPMAQVLSETGAGDNLREDTPRPVLGSIVALANAPVSGSGYFKVPKVIER